MSRTGEVDVQDDGDGRDWPWAADAGSSTVVSSSRILLDKTGTIGALVPPPFSEPVVEADEIDSCRALQ